MECLVCARHSGAVDVPGGSIYEDELVFVGHAGLIPEDVDEVYLGRVLVQPKRQRQINKVLHTAAKVQTGMPHSQGRAYIDRRLAEGKSRAEATRALKRHLSNVVYRALLADVANNEASGEDSQVA